MGIVTKFVAAVAEDHFSRARSVGPSVIFRVGSEGKASSVFRSGEVIWPPKKTFRSLPDYFVLGFCARVAARDLAIMVSNTFWSTSASFLI
jgi:hypothetical protein